MGSCGANRRELEDQSAIKGKIKSNWDKTHFGLSFSESSYEVEEERRREKGREEEEEEVERYGDYLCMETMVLYGIVIWMALYGSVCMDISGSIPRV